MSWSDMIGKICWGLYLNYYSLQETLIKITQTQSSWYRWYGGVFFYDSANLYLVHLTNKQMNKKDKLIKEVSFQRNCGAALVEEYSSVHVI